MGLKQITIRDIPAEIEKIVRKEAENKGLSLNKAFISLIEKATGIKGKEKKAPYHDIDHFFGIWPKEEASSFDKSLAFQRKVDEELWKKAE
ncbi:MAG: hypothetical protein HY880_04710 [Deltaproteobacteria bacterium]|nr:hypothetical protein [Deltaproteobacteria bacterium]